MSTSFDFNAPDRVSVGTVGPVGQRVFLFQCREGSTLVTLKMEKQQVSVVGDLLARIVRSQVRPGHLPEPTPLEEPNEPEWVVGTIGVSYDDDDDRIVLVIEEQAADDEDGAVVRLALTREQAGTFAIQATKLVEQGRPPCPLCGFPLDPSGHDCPRTNGHRPPVV